MSGWHPESTAWEAPLSDAVKKPYDLFISSAEADHAWVEGFLLDALTRAGVRCITEATFRLGVPRLDEFERAIRHSGRTLLVFSASVSADGFTRFAEVLA